MTDGLLGAVYSLQYVTVIQADGETTELDARQTDCVQVVKGKWTSFHEQFSFPSDPKTGKAVMLEPSGK